MKKNQRVKWKTGSVCIMEKASLSPMVNLNITNDGVNQIIMQFLMQ